MRDAIRFAIGVKGNPANQMGYQVTISGFKRSSAVTKVTRPSEVISDHQRFQEELGRYQGDERAETQWRQPPRRIELHLK